MKLKEPGDLMMKRKEANDLLEEIRKRLKNAKKDDKELMGIYAHSVRLILDRIKREYLEPRGYIER